MYAKLVAAQQFQDIETDENKDKNVDSNDNKSLQINNYDKDLLIEDKISDSTDNYDVVRNNMNKMKNVIKSWNILHIYQNAKGNYVKLIGGLLCSIARGQELVLYVMLMKCLFVSLQHYENTHDLKYFAYDQYFILLGNLSTGVYCFVFIFLAVSFF